MSVRSIILCTALALAACGRADPAADGDEPAADAPATAEPGTTARGPSFDCARASGQAQQLICSDAELAVIDREADRLARLVESDPAAAQSQAEWAKARDDCWKSDELRQCVVDSYAARIHALRRAGATTGGAGVSAGPAVFDCGRLAAAVEATFVNTDPGLVHLVWPGTALTLHGAPAASGTRYAGRVDGKAWEFWTKGDEATLVRPGGETISCRAADGE